jgi:hypothetical protein
MKEVMSANDLDCDDLSSICVADSQILWFLAITFGAMDDVKESLQEMVCFLFDVLNFSKEEVF